MNTLGMALSRLFGLAKTRHRWPAGARLATCFPAASQDPSSDPGSACGNNSLALEQVPSCMALALFTFAPKN